MTLTRGDRRRSALLQALDEHLRDAGPDAGLDEINVADLSRGAGVTRSAFYFYFDNKAAAVADLMDEMESEAWDAADLVGGEGVMRDRVAGAVRAVIEGWSRRTHVYRAMLEARATSPGVRDRWKTRLASFVEVVTELIESERAAGRAPAGPDAAALATALLDLNDRTLERLVRNPADPDWDRQVEAVVHIWLSTIYGTAPAPATASPPTPAGPSS